MSPRFIDRILRRTQTVHLLADTPNGDTLLAFIGAEVWRAARRHCNDDLPSLKRLLEYYMMAWNIEFLDRAGVPFPPGAEEFIAQDPEWVARSIERKRRLFSDDPRLFVDAKVLRGQDGELEVHAMATLYPDAGSEPTRTIMAEPPRTIAARIARDRDVSSRQRRKQQKEARRKQRGR